MQSPKLKSKEYCYSVSNNYKIQNSCDKEQGFRLKQMYLPDDVTHSFLIFKLIFKLK